MKTIEFDFECRHCNGSGLYAGFGEHDGAAVVCQTCKGTGKAHFKFEYEEFKGRKKRKDVKQVFEINPGIGIGIKGPDGPLTLEDFGGLSYEDWLKGKRFSSGTEMRKYTCPAWWFQNANYKKKPDWAECESNFSACKSFKSKEKCWERWDKERSVKKVNA